MPLALTVHSRATRSVDGTRVPHIRIGSAGPLPVIIVPGGLDRPEAWHRVAELLATPGRETVILRRPGPGLDRRYSLEREVDDLASVLDSTGPAHVFGHSYGGLIVLRSLLDRDLARVVRSAILYEPVLRRNTDTTIIGDHYDRLQDAMATGDDAITDAVYHYLTGVAHYEPTIAQRLAHSPLIHNMLPGLLPELRTAEDLSWEPRYAHIETPVLLLRGDSSAAHPCWIGHTALAETLPRSVAQILTHAGHTAHHTDPDQLARTVTTWLNHHSIDHPG